MRLYDIKKRAREPFKEETVTAHGRRGLHDEDLVPNEYISFYVGAFSYNHPWRINTYAGILCPRHKTLFLVLLSFIRIKNSIYGDFLKMKPNANIWFGSAL